MLAPGNYVPDLARTTTAFPRKRIFTVGDEKMESVFCWPYAQQCYSHKPTNGAVRNRMRPERFLSKGTLGDGGVASETLTGFSGIPRTSPVAAVSHPASSCLLWQRQEDNMGRVLLRMRDKKRESCQEYCAASTSRCPSVTIAAWPGFVTIGLYQVTPRLSLSCKKWGSERK